MLGFMAGGVEEGRGAERGDGVAAEERGRGEGNNYCYVVRHYWKRSGNQQKVPLIVYISNEKIFVCHNE